MDIRKKLRSYLLSESYCISELEYFIDEMAYPTQFNPIEFKNIKTFKDKIAYSKDRLLGKLGAGSARAVFKIDDEKVLKVALNKKGLAQNEAEGEGYKQNYNVVAKIFDTDDDYMWLEMELAKKISPKRFTELTGTDLNTLGSYLSNVLGRGSKLQPEIKSRYDENEWVGELLNLAGDYNYPVPGDFNRISSYGEVLRDGTPTVVLIDFGLTNDVYVNNYSR